MCLAFGLLVFGIVFLGVLAVRVMTNDGCSKEKLRRNVFTKIGVVAFGGFVLPSVVCDSVGFAAVYHHAYIASSRLILSQQ